MLSSEAFVSRNSRKLRTTVGVGVVALIGVGLVAVAGPSLAHFVPAHLVRVNVSSAGVQDNRGAVPGVGIGGGGRYVVFSSKGTNLVAGLPRAPVARVYLRDRDAGTTELVSVDSSGTAPALGAGDSPTVSGDGNLVAFQSTSVLTPGDTNGSTMDVYLRDRSAGVTTLVSAGLSGLAGNGASFDPMVSADGRYVVFASRASDLVSGDTRGFTDIFARNLQTGLLQRLSITATGGEADGDSSEPAVSPDGLFVAYTSAAANIVPGDLAGFDDVFLIDSGGVIERVSVAGTASQPIELNGHSGHPSVSSAGDYVAFHTEADNYGPTITDTNNALDVVRQYHPTRILQLMSNTISNTWSTGNGASHSPSISDDGAVAFVSEASDLFRSDDNGVADVYRRRGISPRPVSMRFDYASGPANQTDGPSAAPAIDSGGEYIAFTTDATNLVEGDTNCVADVLVSVGYGDDPYRGEPGPPCGPEPVPTTSPLPTVPPVNR
jgi:Tol biopolymer transport system component